MPPRRPFIPLLPNRASLEHILPWDVLKDLGLTYTQFGMMRDGSSNQPIPHPLRVNELNRVIQWSRIVVNLPASLLEQPADEMFSFSTRLRNILRNNGFTTVWAAICLATDYPHFLRMPNGGHISLVELRRELARLHFTIKDPETQAHDAPVYTEPPRTRSFWKWMQFQAPSRTVLSEPADEIRRVGLMPEEPWEQLLPLSVMTTARLRQLTHLCTMEDLVRSYFSGDLADRLTGRKTLKQVNQVLTGFGLSREKALEDLMGSKPFDSRRLIELVLNSASNRDIIIFEARYFEGQTLAAIGLLIGRSSETVRMRLSRIVRRQPKAQRAAAMELSMPVQALLFKWNLVHKSRLPDGIDVGTAAAVLALAGFRDVRPVAREFLTLTKRCQLAAVLRQLRDAERRTRHKERGLEILAGKARIDLQLDVDEESVLRLLAAFQWTQRSSQHSSKPEKWHFLS